MELNPYESPLAVPETFRPVLKRKAGTPVKSAGFLGWHGSERSEAGRIDGMLRYGLALLAVGLLIPAVTTIETQQIDWTPGWPVRLILGGAALLLALGSLFVARGKPG